MEHRTKFKVVGEALTEDGVRITSTIQHTGKPKIRRFPESQHYIADHRPEPGLVYEIVAVRGSDHLLDIDDSRGCPICEASVAFNLADNRRGALQ